MTNNKRKFQTNEEDEPPHKSQKIEDDNTLDHSINILEPCKNGNLDLIKILVERGVSLQERNEFGETCLMIA